MAEIRPRNRRDFVRLRVYGVSVEFAPSPSVWSRSGPPPGSTDRPATALQETGRAPRGSGRGYGDLIAQIYRSDRVVRLERRPATPPRPAADEPAADRTPPEGAIPGELLDVGGGGARFALHEGDWTVRSRPSGHLMFEISGQRFDFNCELVRKTENRNGFEYVALWRRPRPTDIDRLMRAIFQIELSRRQVKPTATVGQPAPRRPHLAFDGNTAMWTAAGVAGGGAIVLLSGAHAVPVWSAVTAALLLSSLLAR